MKALIRWKIDSIKRKLVKFITNGFKIPSNLSKITENIKHSLYEFYLEYFKINTNLIKESNRILNLMFEINTTIDNFEKLPSKYLINIIVVNIKLNPIKIIHKILLCNDKTK